MKVRFLGSGDAFGSGGRFQTCILVEAGGERFLVDCGTSSLIAMRKFAVDPNTIATILITHLHGDHFGGLPFFLLDGQLVSRRDKPLLIAGPPGLRERLRTAMACLFPGSEDIRYRFGIEVVELVPNETNAFPGLAVIPFVVDHPSGAPAFALRIACEGKTLCYTGDTAWTDILVSAARGADILIAEAYFHEKQVKFHLDLAMLAKRLPEIGAKRVILTHMSQDMLKSVDASGFEAALDGLALTV